MKYLIRSHIAPLSLIVLSLILSACGGGDSSMTTGRLAISITDAPVDEAEAVVIYVTNATVQMSNSDNADEQRSVFDILDPVTGQSGRSIDLLQLTEGNSVVLFDEVVTAGQYSWIRLDVDFDPQKTYIQIDGQRYPLSCASCVNNGLKLNRSFNVSADNALALTLDFDLRKSITNPMSDNDYKLRPTIRIVETELAGMIGGIVDETLIAQLGGIEGCGIYIYEGHDATPEDIFLPLVGGIPEEFSNPITTTQVRYNEQASRYEYRAAYLPASEYTITLSCDGELDDPLVNNTGITFTGTADTSITAGETTTYNFDAPPIT